MHRNLTTLLLAGAVAACGGKASTGTTGPTTGVTVGLAPGAYVLVWKNAWLTDGGAGGTNRARASDLAERVVGDAAVLRVIAVHDDTVELVNVRAAAMAEHCHGELDEIDDYELHLFARREDLAPVTSHELTIPFPDGSAITLRAGVALGAGDPHEVRVDEWRFSLSLPAELIGTAYQPSPSLAATGEPFGLLEENAPLRYGGRVVDARPPTVYVKDQAAVSGGQRLVTVTTACAALHVFTDPDGVLEGAVDGIGGMIGGGPGVPQYRIPAGTAVTWPDGRPAGEAVVETTMNGGATRGERVCFVKPLGASENQDADPDGVSVGAFTICFPKADLQYEGPSEPIHADPLP